MTNNIDRIIRGHQKAAEQLENVLRQLSVVDDVSIEIEKGRPPCDLVAEVKVGADKYQLAVEVKTGVTQPRQAKSAALQLDYIINKNGFDATGVLIAPYLSPATRALCREFGIGYLDFVGNAYLNFGSILIERESPNKPHAEQKRLRSLFQPRAIRVLKTLLAEDAERKWRTIELAREAGVSVGHADRTQKALVERDFGEKTKGRFVLLDPAGLLKEWAGEHRQPAAERHEYHSPRPPQELLRDLGSLVQSNPAEPVPATCLASVTAASHLVYMSQAISTLYLYATEEGKERVTDLLDLREGRPGGMAGSEVQIILPENDDVLADTVTSKGGQVCTSPIQTYLDISVEREAPGKRTLEHLKKILLKKINSTKSAQ
jgi:hypothetical protein